jgi:hypothetical protein
MRRKKQHLTHINKVMRDERTMPRIRALFELIALVLDSETPEEKALYLDIVTAQFGADPKRIRWTDPEDPPSAETHLSRQDAKMTEQARGLLGEILKERQDAGNASAS